MCVGLPLTRALSQLNQFAPGDSSFAPWRESSPGPRPLPKALKTAVKQTHL
jgi:hypothetical protein